MRHRWEVRTKNQGRQAEVRWERRNTVAQYLHSTCTVPAQSETIDDKHKNPQSSEGVRPKKGGEMKKAGKLRKQRLVTYSSQDSNRHDETTSEKSTIKLMAVSKIGALMINIIGKEKKWEAQEWRRGKKESM